MSAPFQIFYESLQQSVASSDKLGYRAIRKHGSTNQPVSIREWAETLASEHPEGQKLRLEFSKLIAVRSAYMGK